MCVFFPWGGGVSRQLFFQLKINNLKGPCDFYLFLCIHNHVQCISLVCLHLHLSLLTVCSGSAFNTQKQTKQICIHVHLSSCEYGLQVKVRGQCWVSYGSHSTRFWGQNLTDPCALRLARLESQSEDSSDLFYFCPLPALGVQMHHTDVFRNLSPPPERIKAILSQ